MKRGVNLKLTGSAVATDVNGDVWTNYFRAPSGSVKATVTTVITTTTLTTKVTINSN
jgi:hypothetical protein